MGTYKEDEYVNGEEEAKNKILKACVACLWSFLVSLTGGLILGYWEYKYHLTSSQLWMVPLGLILLVTPVMVWTALVVSEILNCNSKQADDEDSINQTSQPIKTINDSVDDVERYLKETTV